VPPNEALHLTQQPGHPPGAGFRVGRCAAELWRSRHSVGDKSVAVVAFAAYNAAQASLFRLTSSPSSPSSPTPSPRATNAARSPPSQSPRSPQQSATARDTRARLASSSPCESRWRQRSPSPPRACRIGRRSRQICTRQRTKHGPPSAAGTAGRREGPSGRAGGAVAGSYTRAP
jgi:hypothetical protein